jgi:hypothetical protein
MLRQRQIHEVYGLLRQSIFSWAYVSIRALSVQSARLHVKSRLPITYFLERRVTGVIRQFARRGHWNRRRITLPHFSATIPNQRLRPAIPGKSFTAPSWIPDRSRFPLHDSVLADSGHNVLRNAISACLSVSERCRPYS